ncbi:MAG TPA: nucleotidyltransferase domain-containing protein [bacterium]|nr:nucleotidyltransferase domain-containing protein [bacterium]
MEAIDALRTFFSKEKEVAAVYLYGLYAGERSWPDTDIEIAVLFPEGTAEEAIGAYMERLSEESPLGGHPGILMPFALNTHTLPVVYEILRGGTLLVDNDPAARETFVRGAEERIGEARATIVEEAREAILQARNLGFSVVATDGFMLPQPPRYLDPIRIGWRLARILTSVVMLDQTTREPERAARDAERVGQMLGLFTNAAGAATGIGKAMLNMFEMTRPARRWEIFLPLADADLMTTELALQLGAAIEMRWSLMTGSGLLSPERVGVGIRGTLAPIISFSRLAAWYCDVPGRADQPVH